MDSLSDNIDASLIERRFNVDWIGDSIWRRENWNQQAERDTCVGDDSNEIDSSSVSGIDAVIVIVCCTLSHVDLCFFD